MKNWKGVLTILLMSVLSLGFSLSAFAAETEALQLKSKSAVLMDAGTGTVLYEKNSHEAMPPASVTKVMTLLLIYEAEAAGQFEWEEAVQVSEHAASMGGSQVFLEPGETQTAAELTKCIAIASANDAAVAMAEFVAGSEEAFVERMNRKAEELGMQETHFVNACGLDVDGHETSAYDIALMSRELMTKFPEIQKYTTTWQDTIIHKTRKGESEFGLTNTNKLIKWYEGATGLKTGSTGKALYCLSGTAERNGMHLIGVVMAAPGSARQGVGGSAQGAQGGSLPKAELPKAIPEDVKQVLTNWGGILSQLTGVTKTYLKMATRSLGPNGELMLVFDDKNAYEYVEQNRSDCQDALKAAAADRIGKAVAILVKLNDTGHASDEVYPDLGALIQMDIEEEDF